MKNRTSSHSRPDLIGLLKNTQYQILLDYATERQQDIFAEWLEQDEEDFRIILRYEYALLDETLDFLHTDEMRYAILRLGSLLGTVECFERVFFERREDQWAQARFQKEVIQVKHLPKVIQALETHGSMFHAELGEYLGLNAPTLTEAMKKILDTGAVQASPSGKYKIYTLTDAGLRYGRELRKKKRCKDPVEEAFQTIRKHLENMSKEMARKTVKAALPDMIDGDIRIDLHWGDIAWRGCYFPIKRAVAVQDGTVYDDSKENLPFQELLPDGVKSLPVLKNRKKRLSNTSPAFARALKCSI